MCKRWSTINDILNKSRKTKSFWEAFKEDGQTISDKIEIANKFNLYFTNIGLNIARKIKTPSNIHFSDYLKTKYNNVFKFKAVTTGEVEKNNRQSEISNVFEKVIFIQTYKIFSIKNIFYKNQYGVREGHSTDLAALKLDRMIQEMDKGETCFNVFLDLSKAFGTIDHAILLHKLEYYGIKHNELKLFNSYLTDHKQFADIEGTKSEMLEIKTGVPKGSVLGPLLFIIYMNDISVASEMFKPPIIYADDSTLTSILCAFNLNNDNNNNSDKINSELNKISDWLKLNKSHRSLTTL